MSQTDRKPLLSVANQEDTTVTFGKLVNIYLLGVFFYVWGSGGWNIPNIPLYLTLVWKNAPIAIHVIIGIIILMEAVSIMIFRSFHVTKQLDQAKAEGKAEEREQWSEWNNRREQAAAQGKPFNEKPPDARRD